MSMSIIDSRNATSIDLNNNYKFKQINISPTVAKFFELNNIEMKKNKNTGLFGICLPKDFSSTVQQDSNDDTFVQLVLAKNGKNIFGIKVQPIDKHIFEISEFSIIAPLNKVKIEEDKPVLVRPITPTQPKTLDYSKPVSIPSKPPRWETNQTAVTASKAKKH